MLIYGLDITSAPSRNKPITCAHALISSASVTIAELEKFETFAEFENFLQRPGPWCAGLDFPFGQPLELLSNLRLAGGWAESVMALTRGEMTDFVNLLDGYRKPRPKGHKHHWRRVDEKAKSLSPMTLYGTPVAKMYFRVAPRLIKAGVNIVPVHRNGESRVVVEAYPKLVANRYSGGRKYKADAKKNQTPSMIDVRAEIVGGLEHHAQRDFGFSVRFTPKVRHESLRDPTGDVLDAVLCSVQAGWFNANPSCAIPLDCNLVEGWIVDPGLLE
jgi:hypothetical protein